jgi:hypothetical protein
MAVAHVQTLKQTSAGGGGTTITLGATLSSGNLLIVGVCVTDTGSGNPLVNSVTWNGVALSQRITRQAATTDTRIYIWALENVTGATANIVANCTRLGRGTLFAIEVSGAATASADDGVGASATASGTNPASGNFTATNTDDFWVGLMANEATGVDATIAAGAGWSIDATNGIHTSGTGAVRAAMEYRANPGSAGAFNGNFTAATGPWAAAVFAFKAAAGGGGATQPPRTAHQFRQRRAA